MAAPSHLLCPPRKTVSEASAFAFAHKILISHMDVLSFILLTPRGVEKIAKLQGKARITLASV